MFEFIVAVAVAVAVSIVVGEWDSTSSGNSGGVDQDGTKCEGCRKAKAWYNRLPGWKKALYAGWYAYKWTQCRASGCPF
jgi:hypothetical protein